MYIHMGIFQETCHFKIEKVNWKNRYTLYFKLVCKFYENIKRKLFMKDDYMRTVSFKITPETKLIFLKNSFKIT